MANGNNNPRYTFHTVVDAIANDPKVTEMLLSSVSAAEEPPRSPVALYLDTIKSLKASGNDAATVNAILNSLPEPNSNQGKKLNGLNEHVGDNERAVRDADPVRFWDKYEYTDKSGITVKGSVYSDMAARHPLGKSFKDDISLIDDWKNAETKKSSLRQTIRFNGTELEMSTLPNDRRDTIRSTLTSRFNKLADNFRTMAGVHINKMDIEERMKHAVRVRFIYNKEGDESSGLAELKETIRIVRLETNKESEDYGQPTGAQMAFTAKAFANLSVDQAIEKGGDGGATYATLIDSKKVRQKLQKKGESTQEKEKAEIEGLVTSASLEKVLLNIRVYTDNEKAKANLLNYLSRQKKEDRELYIANALDVADWLLSVFDKKEYRALQSSEAATRAERAAQALAAQMTVDKERAALESAPTQHQRNAAEQERQQANGEIERQQDAAFHGQTAPGTGPQPDVTVRPAAGGAAPAASQSSHKTAGKKKSGAR